MDSGKIILRKKKETYNYIEVYRFHLKVNFCNVAVFKILPKVKKIYCKLLH